MNDKLKQAFGQVQAGQELKETTKTFLARKTRGYTRTKIVNFKPLIAEAAGLLFVLIGGCGLYFTPTAEISIDINPSIELSVNRFDQVISVNGRNEGGKELADTLQLSFTDYTEAVSRILESQKVAALLSDDAVMTIAVIGPDGAQSVRILSGVEEYTEGRRNTYCYSAHAEEVEAAHEMGLSYGKYRAFLEWQALDPDITPEEVQGMSMREIRDRINALSDGEEQGTQTNENGGRRGHGAGSGEGNGRKNRAEEHSENKHKKQAGRP